MNPGDEFRRIAIVGAGLMGASFGAAASQAWADASVVAYDRPEVLRKLHEQGFGWDASESLETAIRGADLIYVALPVLTTIEVLPEIAAKCASDALVTDSGSTKVQVCKIGDANFGSRDRQKAAFVGGHPIAGKESAGFEHVDAQLLRGARYVLIGDADARDEERDPRVQKFIRLLRAMGAEPVWCDANSHDWAMAVVSHLPQLVAVALARVIEDERDETGLPVSLAGKGLRDMLRIAGSPYSIWRDICMTNTENIGRTLDRAAQAIHSLRAHLVNGELAEDFRRANQIYNALQNGR